MSNKLMFLEIANVKGSEKNGTLSGLIPIFDFSYNIQRQVRSNNGSGKNKEMSLPQISNISISKPACSASTGIHKESLVGLGQVMKIRVVENAGEANSHYSNIITLNNAIIMSYAVKGNIDNGISENIEIAFSSYSIENTPVTSLGTKGSPSSFGYDVSKMKKL